MDRMKNWNFVGTVAGMMMSMDAKNDKSMTKRKGGFEKD